MAGSAKVDLYQALGVERPRSARSDPSPNRDNRDFRLSKLPSDATSLEKRKNELTGQMVKVGELLLHSDNKVALRASGALNGLIRDVIENNQKLKTIRGAKSEFFSPSEAILRGFDVLKPGAPQSELLGSLHTATPERMREMFHGAVVQALNVLKPEAKREFLTGLESRTWLPAPCRDALGELKERHWFSSKAQAALAALGV